MAGTVEGNQAGARTNKKNDPDFYGKIGAKGGKAKVPKGFAVNRELARLMGKKHGRGLNKTDA